MSTSILKGRYIFGTNQQEHCAFCGVNDATGEKCKEQGCNCARCACSIQGQYKRRRQENCEHPTDKAEVTERMYGRDVSFRCGECGADL